MKPDYRIKNKDIFKGTIRHILFKYGKMTAKEIQHRIGLGRQTTYNYLQELESEKLVSAEYQSVPNKPNLSVAYYSVIPVRFPAELDDLPYTDRPKNLFLPHDVIMKRINRVLDMSIASIIETKTAINNMTESEFSEYYSFSPKVDGFMNHLFLLSDEVFEKYQLETKKLVDRLVAEDTERGAHDGHSFLVSFFKKAPIRVKSLETSK